MNFLFVDLKLEMLKYDKKHTFRKACDCLSTHLHGCMTNLENKNLPKIPSSAGRVSAVCIVFYQWMLLTCLNLVRHVMSGWPSAEEGEGIGFTAAPNL